MIYDFIHIFTITIILLALTYQSLKCVFNSLFLPCSSLVESNFLTGRKCRDTRMKNLQNKPTNLHVHQGIYSSTNCN